MPTKEEAGVDCKTVGFFLKISKEIGKARESPSSFSVFSLVPDLLFDFRANTLTYGLFCSLRLEGNHVTYFAYCVQFFQQQKAFTTTRFLERQRRDTILDMYSKTFKIIPGVGTG